VSAPTTPTINRTSLTTLRSVRVWQGKILATGDITSLEPPFFGCACFSEWEPCGGCTAFGCSKLC
jgi:hypothetical protein